jgi:hypothetical protein
MYGPNYPAWQNNCNRCEAYRIKEIQHADELAKAKSQLVYSGPIVDSQSVAEIENEEIRAELAELRAKLAAAEALLDHLQETQQGVYFIPGEDGEDGQFSVAQYSDPDIRKAITASMEAE